MSKKNKTGLGRCLIKDRFNNKHKRMVDNDSMLHTTEVQDGYDWGRLNLQSITEESSFQEFLRTAELAGREFQAEKRNVTFVNKSVNEGLLSRTEENSLKKKHLDKKNLLKVPRRPKWTTEMTAEALQKAENESFLEWRRNLAQLQEKDEILLTPYEKNLEFWRQLWRVIEKSDVVVQIVDARNPLQFRSEDLEKYVKEVGEEKMNLILLNKSDLLTENQRIRWARYFDLEGMRVAFFSATLTEEENKSEKEKQKQTNAENGNIAGDSESDQENKEKLSVSEITSAVDEIVKGLDKTETQLKEFEKKIGMLDKREKNSPEILSRCQLIEFFRNIYKGPTITPNVVTIGLVGYPNVGKSSTINALMTEKKVSVSATPGKTKHFQTLFLEKDIMLCDCPGLVMPSFVVTKADMILNGILPIDQMRDHVPPVNLLCTRIPRHILEDKYGIVIAKPSEYEDPNRPPFADELLLAYGYNRGFMTARGQPDQSRSARYILKDYVNGKLLYCYAPPKDNQETFHTFPARVKKETDEKVLPARQQMAMRIDKPVSTKEIDKEFFQSQSSTAHAKGRSNFPYSGSSSQNVSVLGADGQEYKPWRKPKREKREKLRKKFSHLDQH